MAAGWPRIALMRLQLRLVKRIHKGNVKHKTEVLPNIKVAIKETHKNESLFQHYKDNLKTLHTLPIK